MHPSVKQRRLWAQRYVGIRSQGEHTLAYSACWLFWQTAEPGLIKCSDKNQSFIKVCSHSGSTRPRSWNVSWKPASLAQECCLSYLIRRSCCEGVGARVGEEEGSLAAACLLLGPSLASLQAHWPIRVCPLYKSHARWRKSTQRLPGEQTRPIALAAAPLSFLCSPRSCPTRNSTACSAPYFKQDFFFTLSLLCQLAQCQISKLIKRGMDWAYIFPSLVSSWQSF